MRGLPDFGVRKPVVANLIMLALLGAGVVFGTQLTREFFPEVRPNEVLVTAPYPGASPDEVERALAIKIEDRIADLTDVEEITSTVVEGAVTLRIEFREGVRIQDAVAEVKREIDALQDLPERSERIIVDSLEPNLPVIVLSLFGEADERAMKRAIRRMRDDLRTLPSMGDLLIGGIRSDEVTVEVRPEAAVEHGLSLPEISSLIRDAMQEVPGGAVRTPSANISVRTMGAEDRAAEVRRVVLRSTPGGRALRVGDIAEVRDGFVDVDVRTRLNGQPSVSLTAFKVGRDQDSVKIAELVKAYAAGLRGEELSLNTRERLASLVRRPGDASPVSERVRAYELGVRRAAESPPPGEVALTTDLARFIVDRLELLTRNALWGGMLVFITLMLLLSWRVSLWVAVGILVSLAGTLAMMYWWGITLNLLTMFGLIVVIGLLVDDAIVVAENIAARHERGEPSLVAAVNGTTQVGWPVVATVLTSICAFMPLALIGGRLGDMLEALPIVVAVALLVSLIECLIILPSHMAFSLKGADRDQRGEAGSTKLGRLEARYDRARDRVFNRVVIPWYLKFVNVCVRGRYLTVCVAIGLVIVSLGMVAGGRLEFIFLEDEDAETVDGRLRMPIGTPADETDRIMRRIEAASLAQPEVDAVFAVVGALGDLEGRGSAQQSHLGQVILELKPVEKRDRPSPEVISSIRRELGELPGVRSFEMESVGGGPGGPPITLTVAGDDDRTIMPVVEAIRDLLDDYEGVVNIADNADAGQREVRFSLRDGGRELGLSTAGVAEQIRAAVFGLEAYTFAGDQEDIDVRVIAPKSVRRSLAAIERMHIFTPDGRSVPLNEVADVEEREGYATVRRLDRRRAVTVTAYVERAITNPETVMADLRPMLERLEAEHPGIAIMERGRQQDMRDSFATLPLGMAVACGLIYVILAWLFSSYIQPLVVMLAIPFATIGMIWGHLALGFSMTFLSLIGFIALAGVVVNDSLIYMKFYNQLREGGMAIGRAVQEAGRARLRAILLTTITTVLALSPFMLEQSFQARFLIPMAITIACGLMSATVIILVVIPCMLVILDDARRGLTALWTGRPVEPAAEIVPIDTNTMLLIQDDGSVRTVPYNGVADSGYAPAETGTDAGTDVGAGRGGDAEVGPDR